MKHIQKLFLFFTVGLLLTSFFLSALEPLVGTANAAETNPEPGGGATAPGIDDTIENQVKSYLYVRAVARCIKAADLHDETHAFGGYDRVNKDNASNFTWFFGGKVGGDTDTWTGYLDADDGNGKSSCHDLNGAMLTTAYSIWQLGQTGGDGIASICNSGFTREGDNNSQSPTECIKGTEGKFVRPNGDKSKAANEFIANVMSQYYGQASSALPTLKDEMKYFLYYNSVVKGCHATQRDNTTTPYTDEEIASNDHLVKMLATDGTTVEVWELGDSYTKGTSVTIGTNDSLNGGTSMKCGDLAAGAVKYAPAYAAAVAANPNAGNTGGDDAVNSCENSGVSLAWIMCSVLDGLANAVGYAYTDIIQPLLTTPPLDVTGTAETSSPQAAGLKKAWSGFRDIANVLLVLFVLALVFGEAIGGGRA